MAWGSSSLLPVSRRSSMRRRETDMRRHGYDGCEYRHAAMGQLQPGTALESTRHGESANGTTEWRARVLVRAA
jgi:hypothetical protein